MRQTCWIVPLKEGGAEVLRSFNESLNNERRDDYTKSQQKIGMLAEDWFYWQDASGKEYCVLYMAAHDIDKTMRDWVDANDEFERWAKDLLAQMSDDWPEPLWNFAHPRVAQLLSEHPLDG